MNGAPLDNRRVAGTSLKAKQSERTKALLVAAGRSLFAERGYAGVSAEEVAAAAGVTTGAVYHHFGSKQGLFVAVFEAVEEQVTARVAGAAGMHTDPWRGFMAAALAFIDASTEPEIRQVVLIDGRAVLGWDEWHSIMARYGLGMTRAVIGQLIAGELLPVLPVDALSALIFGALSEGALHVATAADPVTARNETVTALEHLLNALATK